MRLAAALGALTLLATPAAGLAGPADGVWRTQSEGGTVRIGSCGAELCGWLHDTPELKRYPEARDLRNQDPSKRERKIAGLLLLEGFAGGPKQWTGGKIYNPADGRSYRSELTLADPNTLKVKGCVGPVCRTQTWTRAR